MNDRELLEAAAKAAGYEVRWHEVWQCHVHEGPYNTDSPPTLAGQRHVWVPLTDDGDALRLAVKLEIRIAYSMNGIGATFTTIRPDDDGITERHENDPCAATRRAIVRAAAAVGKTPNV